MINVDDIPDCYVYRNSWVSILHCFMCSCIVACGYIAAATMHQIRCSIQVILKQSDAEKAERRIKRFYFTVLGIWLIN